MTVKRTWPFCLVKTLTPADLPNGQEHKCLSPIASYMLRNFLLLVIWLGRETNCPWVMPSNFTYSYTYLCSYIATCICKYIWQYIIECLGVMLLQFLVISDLSVATFVIPHITRFRFKQIQFAVLLSVLVHLLMQVCVCVCMCTRTYMWGAYKHTSIFYLC